MKNEIRMEEPNGTTYKIMESLAIQTVMSFVRYNEVATNIDERTKLIASWQISYSICCYTKDC